jgi:hypothetical protein
MSTQSILTAIPSHPARRVDTVNRVEVNEDGDVLISFTNEGKQRGRRSGESVVMLTAAHFAEIVTAVGKPAAPRRKPAARKAKAA